MQKHDAKPALFAALVHETVKADPTASRTDLLEAVKCAAARLHLRYDSRILGDAIDHVERVRATPSARAWRRA